MINGADCGFSTCDNGDKKDSTFNIDLDDNFDLDGEESSRQVT